MNELRARLQHLLNPLHFYCRLRRLGMTGATAHKVSLFYERHVFCRLALY